MEWLTPWYSIAHEAEQAAAMVRELYRELGDGHQLYGLTLQAVGRRVDCDDVLFAINDGSERVAVVHLTWVRSPPDRPPWPITSVYRNFADWMVNRMVRDHQDRLNVAPEADD